MLDDVDELAQDVLVLAVGQPAEAEVGQGLAAGDALAHGDQGEIQVVRGVGDEEGVGVEGEAGGRQAVALVVGLVVELQQEAAGVVGAGDDVVVGEEQAPGGQEAAAEGVAVAEEDAGDRRGGGLAGRQERDGQVIDGRAEQPLGAVALVAAQFFGGRFALDDAPGLVGVQACDGLHAEDAALKVRLRLEGVVLAIRLGDPPPRGPGFLGLDAGAGGRGDLPVPLVVLRHGGNSSSDEKK